MNKLREFLKKVQNLPEKKRKIIFWATIIILGTCLFIFYVQNISQRIKSFPKEKFIKDLNTPSFKEETKGGSEIKEGFNVLEEALKQSQQQDETKSQKTE